MLLQEKVGIRKLYRTSEDMREGRVLKPLNTTTWYKSRRGGSKIATILDNPIRQPTEERDKGGDGRRRGLRSKGKEKEGSKLRLFIGYGGITVSLKPRNSHPKRMRFSLKRLSRSLHFQRKA